MKIIAKCVGMRMAHELRVSATPAPHLSVKTERSKPRTPLLFYVVEVGGWAREQLGTLPGNVGVLGMCSVFSFYLISLSSHPST